MRKLPSTFSAFLAAALICGAVSIHAQQAANSDPTEILTAARGQLPGGLAPNSVQTYLDGIAAYIHGYPLVSIAVTERVLPNVEYANQQLGTAPLNQLYRAMV